MFYLPNISKHFQTLPTKLSLRACKSNRDSNMKYESNQTLPCFLGIISRILKPEIFFLNKLDLTGDFPVTSCPIIFKSMTDWRTFSCTIKTYLLVSLFSLCVYGIRGSQVFPSRLCTRGSYLGCGPDLFYWMKSFSKFGNFLVIVYHAGVQSSDLNILQVRTAPGVEIISKNINTNIFLWLSINITKDFRLPTENIVIDNQRNIFSILEVDVMMSMKPIV